MFVNLPRREAYEWITYSYRHQTEEASKEFGSWLVLNDWTEVLEAEGSEAKAAAFHRHVDLAMDTFFPLRTVRKRSTDLP